MRTASGALRTASRARRAAGARFLAPALVLTLLLGSGLLPGCAKKPATPPGAGAPPATAAPPRITAIRLDPDCARTGGFYNVEPGPLTIIVEATGADRVEFGLSPTGTGQVPQAAGVDEDPGDGWRFTWNVPDEDIMMHLTITARSANGETSEVIGLYHERGTGEPPGTPVGGREPLGLDRAASPRWSIDYIPNLPKYFFATAWLDESHLLGMTGTTPIVVDVGGGGWNALDVDAWWAAPDPSGQRIAYANNGGLYVTAASGDAGAGQVLIEAKPQSADAAGPPGGVLWSPDGSRLLYWYVYEWNLDFYVIDAAGGQPRQVSPTPEGYFLTEAVAWADANTVVFNTRAVRSLTGENEYRSVGYRGDIATCNVQTGEVRLLTANPDGTFWNATQRLGDGRLVFWIGEPGRSLQGFATLAADGTVQRLQTDPQAESISFAPGGRRWLERCRAQAQASSGGATPDNESARLVMHDGGAGQPWANVFYGERLEGPLWSPSGRRLAFSLDAYGVVTGGGLTYVTYIIDERQ